MPENDNCSFIKEVVKMKRSVRLLLTSVIAGLLAVMLCLPVAATENQGELPEKEPETVSGEVIKEPQEGEMPAGDAEAPEEASENDAEAAAKNAGEEPPAGGEPSAGEEPEEDGIKIVSYNGSGQNPGKQKYRLDLTNKTADLISAEGDGCDIVVPGSLSYLEETYKVTGIYNDAVDAGIGSFAVDGGLRTISGNLFDWNKVKERNVGIVGTDPEGYYGFYNKAHSDYHNTYYDGYIIEDIPDTGATLDAVPDFIKNNYEDGAYYAGKCLVKADPAYQGNFTVKDGTVCILASAFEGCDHIMNVTLPDSVEFIGMRAFANSSVTGVNFPTGLIGHSDNIAAYTFYGCNKLSSVTFGEGVTLSDIGPYAFMDCSKLEGFDFSKVGNNALEVMCFAGAFDGDAEITLSPEKLTCKPFDYIGPFHPGSSETPDSQFDYYYGVNAPGQFAKAGIKSVTFTDNTSVTKGWDAIPSCCFYNSASLESVTLCSSIKNLLACCFEGCSKLTGDILAQENCAVKMLDYRCLARTGLTKITIPESITSCSGGVFAQDPELTDMVWKSGSYSSSVFAILNDISRESDSSFKTKVDSGNIGYPDEYLKKPEKNGNTFITDLELYLPYSEYLYLPTMFNLQPYLETVKIYNPKNKDITICSNMFLACPSLSDVTFDNPEKITKIGDNAFLYCPSLKSFPFTEMTNLTEIGSNAFLMTNLSICNTFNAETLEGLADTDPRKDYGLTEVDLSKCTELTSIGTAAFYMQYNMESLKLPEKANLNNGPGGTFCGCYSLKNLEADCPLSNLCRKNVQYGSTTYDFSANFALNTDKRFSVLKEGSSFTGSVNHVLETLILNNAGEIKNNQCFNNMPGLKNVTLKNTEVIPNGMFVNCLSLENVSLPDTKTLGDDSSYTPLFFGCPDFTLYAPEVTKVGDHAFEGALFTELDLPKATDFGKFAFANSDALKSFNIAEGTKELSWFMFDDCDSLESVTLPSTLETVGWAAFKNCPKLTKVSIPSAVKLIDDDAFAMTDAEAFDIENVPIINQGNGIPGFLNSIARKTRQGRLKLTLAGAPEIKTSLSSNDMSKRGDYLIDNAISKISPSKLTDEGPAAREAIKEETKDLLPIPDGSTAICESEDAIDAAGRYKQEHAPNLVISDEAEVSVEDISVTYSGEAVSGNLINGTATFKGESITGTWAFKEGQELTNVADSGVKTVIFTPDDTQISPVEASLNLTIPI